MTKLGTSRSYCCPVISVKSRFWFLFLSKRYFFFTVILSPVLLSLLETCSGYLNTGRLDFVVYNNDKSTVIYAVQESILWNYKSVCYVWEGELLLLYFGEEVRVLWMTV